MLVAEKQERRAAGRLIADEELMAEIRQNPEQGLAAALEVYGGLVKAVCRRALGGASPQDVEECVAESFWRLYKSAASWQSGRSLKSWLCGIARHIALDRRRSLCRLVPVSEGAELEQLADPADLVEQLGTLEQRRLVQECVCALAEPDRQIFIRRYFWGEKVGAIAAALQLPPKTVENRLYRGRQRLRTALLERGISV